MDYTLTPAINSYPLRTPESKTRVWSRSLDPISSIGHLLSITEGRV